MELHLVADTNLFFECRALHELPWADLGYDKVVILLTKPVLDEIDKHKKASGRTRARALAIFGQVREMLESSEIEVEVQASGPRVVMRRLSIAKPDPELEEDLDYSKNDDRLVGIASSLNKKAAGYHVRLFTNDTGPAANAEDLAVPYFMIKEEWRRPPAETTEEKRIKDLEKDLATYRAQEPKIVIRPCETAADGNVVRVTRRVATPLSKEEVEDLVGCLRSKFPINQDFTPPDTQISQDEWGGVTTVEYDVPAQEDIDNYQRVAYPAWVEECRKILETLHHGRDEPEAALLIRWSMSNVGSRPASQVRVEFEAKGPLKLRRRVDDDDGDEVEPNVEEPPRPLTSLPPPPEPPAFRQKVTLKARPTPPVTSQNARLPALRTSGIAAQFNELDKLTKALSHLGALENLRDFGKVKSFPTGLDLAKFAGLPKNYDFPVDRHRSAIATFEPIASDLRLPSFTSSLPEPQDPEGFYYDWPTEGVKRGALTCDLWRHHKEDEVFEFEVEFDTDAPARGIVECTVHAENLTKPAQAKVKVERGIETFSLLDLATAMVGAIG